MNKKHHNQSRYKLSRNNKNEHYTFVRYAKHHEIVAYENEIHCFRHINRVLDHTYYYCDDDQSPFVQKHSTGWKYSTKNRKQWM